jgi:hypothetical protein
MTTEPSVRSAVPLADVLPGQGTQPGGSRGWSDRCGNRRGSAIVPDTVCNLTRPGGRRALVFHLKPSNQAFVRVQRACPVIDRLQELHQPPRRALVFRCQLRRATRRRGRTYDLALLLRLLRHAPEDFRRRPPQCVTLQGQPLIEFRQPRNEKARQQIAPVAGRSILQMAGADRGAEARGVAIHDLAVERNILRAQPDDRIAAERFAQKVDRLRERAPPDFLRHLRPEQAEQRVAFDHRLAVREREVHQQCRAPWLLQDRVDEGAVPIAEVQYAENVQTISHRFP